LSWLGLVAVFAVIYLSDFTSLSISPLYISLLPRHLVICCHQMRRLQLLFAASVRDPSSKIRLMSSRSSSNIPDRTNILAESWSTISNEYEKVLVPRFAPWTEDALDALRIAISKDGRCQPDVNIPSTALVLCCGPGHELLPIAKMLGPASTLMGTDLAPGMISAARKRVEEECNENGNFIYKDCIRAEVGNAMDPPPGPFNVIFSAFGLQQLPNPIQAVGSWLNVMEPGGICACIYWPPNPPKISNDEKNPFHLWGELVNKKLGKEGIKNFSWDENIDVAVAAADGKIIDDKFITHDICWKDAKSMFEGMSQAGPWHAMRLRRGDRFVDELGMELEALYPAGNSLCHKFTARMIVVQRNHISSSVKEH